MKYLESEQIKQHPELYTGIKESISWILREPFIFEYFGRLPRVSRIVEIGAGSGLFLSRLQGMGFSDLAGVDLGNYLTDKTFEHHIVDLNVEKMPFPDGSIDVLVGFQILEHLENYFLILQEAKRVLKKRGLFIYSVPNPFNIFYRFKFALTGNMPGYTLDNNHLLFLTRDVFKKTFLRDFDLVETFFSKGPVPALGRLNIIPGVHFPAKVRILPRAEIFADRVCYFLKKR